MSIMDIVPDIHQARKLAEELTELFSQGLKGTDLTDAQERKRWLWSQAYRGQHVWGRHAEAVLRFNDDKQAQSYLQAKKIEDDWNAVLEILNKIEE